MQSESKSSSQTATLSTTPAAGWFGWIPLIICPLAVMFGFHLPAWAFMWLLAFALFAGLKWITWWKARAIAHENWRSVAYLFGWPGMDAEKFLDSNPPIAKPRGREWFWATIKTTGGILLIWAVAHRVSAPMAQGWIGLCGLVLLLHFGSFHLIALFWQTFGVAAEPIMAKPLLSKSLSEFWGKRWNLGFRQLAHDFIFHPLHRQTGVAAASLLVFVVSGVIHDLVISLPARGGYGLPTGYFLLQGLGVSMERSSFGRRVGLQGGIFGWLFMFVFTAGPAFWLFHPLFVMRVILPFMHTIGAL